MALTPAEQAELDQLEAQQHDQVSREFGEPIANSYVDAVSKPVRPEDETHSSLFRTVFGGLVRDPLANTVDALKDIGASFGSLERSAKNLLGESGTQALEGALNTIFPGSITVGRTTQAINATGVSIPDLPGSEHAGTAEKLGRSVLSFLVPFAGWSKAMSAEEAGLQIGQRLIRGTEAAALTNVFNQDPEQINLATTLKDTFGIDSSTLDALAYNSEGDDLVERLKAAATNIPLDIAASSLFEAGAAGIRTYKAWRGAAEDAKGVVAAMEHDYGILRPKAAEATNPEAEADALLRAGTPSEAPFDKAIHVALNESPPKTWEDVISFLNRVVDDPKLKGETVDELARIAHEDPENALTRLGIDPAKLDYEAFDNPEGVQNLHNALINVYEKAAKRIGRTGERVTEAAILRTSARAFASDADVLRALFGKTRNLPEILMGARMFVGGHSKRLLDDAQAALDAMRAGGEGAGTQEWQKFLESFYRHALYLGSLRGAGSEIARALRSLQFIARHDPKQAEAYAATLGKMVPAGNPAAKAAEDVAQEQLHGLLSMETNAERMMALSKLLEKEGDTGALAMFVRRQNGSAFKQLDGAVREEVGNLFSQGTAAYNFAASMTMMGLRGLGRWMAAGARLPMALLSPEQARLARIARADAWAYTDGMMLGWAESWRNMLIALKADGATELFLNADNLGLKGLAKKAAEWNAEGAKLSASGKNFERIDMRAAQHVIALSPSDRRALDQWIESYGMPRLMEGAMKWMARTAGVVINAAGTATRAGTILFVNAPDQLAGTLAAKAGAQSAAVREAARRAAELGIEGKQLSTYLKARVTSLASDTEGWADQGYEEGFRDVVRAAGEHEARAVLFQDRLEGRINRALTKAHHEPSVILPLAIPFLHTPLRILERSLIDYTPLGIFKSRIREAVLRGTPEQREQALSQMALGIMGMYLGYHLSDGRTIIGKDGSFYSTARLARESYTVKVGGDTFEYSRLDPISTIVGLASDYHAYMNTHYDPNDPQSVSYAEAMFEAGAWAITANVLSKTYLQSLARITDVVNSTTEGQFDAKFSALWKDMLARRNVPGAGIQKGIRQIYDPFEHEAVSFYDKVLKETIGATKLPVKRDWLGLPVETNFGERFTGLAWEPYKGDEDPLRKELDQVSIDTRLPQKNYKGVKLTAQQYSRLLELRGQVVEGKYGKMGDALRQLIELPEYQGLTRDAKEFQIKQLMDGYTELAHKALMKEDKPFAGQVYLEEAYQDAKNKGARPDELKQKAQEFRRQLDALGFM